MGITLRLRFPFFIRQGRSATAYAPLDVPDKGTNAGARLFRRAIYWGHLGPIIPNSGAYAIRPYTSGRLFSSEWVGAYCIRPIRRSRQGNEHGFFVVSLGDLLGTIRALWCPIVGRIQYTPTLTVEKTGSFFESVCFQGSYFSSEWVGRKSIRPIRRSRQGNERKHPVLPTITQRQPPGPYRTRLWGVCNTPLP